MPPSTGCDWPAARTFPPADAAAPGIFSFCGIAGAVGIRTEPWRRRGSASGSEWTQNVHPAGSRTTTPGRVTPFRLPPRGSFRENLEPLDSPHRREVGDGGAAEVKLVMFGKSASTADRAAASGRGTARSHRPRKRLGFRDRGTFPGSNRRHHATHAAMMSADRAANPVHSSSASRASSTRRFPWASSSFDSPPFFGRGTGVSNFSN